MVIEIRLISSKDQMHFQKKLDEFLQIHSLSRDQLIDVKFNSNGNDSSALIIYEKETSWSKNFNK